MRLWLWRWLARIHDSLHQVDTMARFYTVAEHRDATNYVYDTAPDAREER